MNTRNNQNLTIKKIAKYINKKQSIRNNYLASKPVDISAVLKV